MLTLTKPTSCGRKISPQVYNKVWTDDYVLCARAVWPHVLLSAARKLATTWQPCMRMCRWLGVLILICRYPGQEEHCRLLLEGP